MPPRPGRPLLSVRQMNGEHEIVVVLTRRQRIVLGALVVLLIANNATGFFERLAGLVDLLGALF